MSGGEILIFKELLFFTFENKKWFPKNKRSPIKPLKIAHNINALFILCGKNHVWILFEASEKNSLESSDIGMKEKQAIKPLKKNKPQKIYFETPIGWGTSFGFD